jgi:hypothetical protein
MRRLFITLCFVATCAGPNGGRRDREKGWAAAERLARPAVQSVPSRVARNEQELKDAADRGERIWLVRTLSGNLPGTLDTQNVIVAVEKKTRCPFHDEALQQETVPIFYGFPLGNPTEDAEAAGFPYAREAVHGGCDAANGVPKHARVKYCPACRSAKRAWMARHVAP